VQVTHCSLDGRRTENVTTAEFHEWYVNCSFQASSLLDIPQVADPQRVLLSAKLLRARSWLNGGTFLDGEYIDTYAYIPYGLVKRSALTQGR